MTITADDFPATVRALRSELPADFEGRLTFHVARTGRIKVECSSFAVVEPENGPALTRCQENV